MLFEMLSGRRAFEGANSSDTIAAVLRQEIDWAALPAETPKAVARLIARCLDRDVKRRLRDIGEARVVLDDSGAGGIGSLDPARGSLDGPDAGPDPHARPLFRGAGLVLLSAMVTGALAATAWYASHTPAAPLAVTRFTFNLPEGQTFTGLSGRAIALSPDGTLIAYVSNGRLHLRSMSDLDGKPIQGTEGFRAVADPVFSPDGRALAFHTVFDQTLKRIVLGPGTS